MQTFRKSVRTNFLRIVLVADVQQVNELAHDTYGWIHCGHYTTHTHTLASQQMCRQYNDDKIN